MDNKKFPFNLSKEEKQNHLKTFFWFFIISLILLPFGIGALGLAIFFLWFLIENLIVMWRTKHYWWFIFSLASEGFFAIIFYFVYYYPYLKGDKTEKEIIF